MQFLWGGRSRQESPYPFRRSAQACYGPQGSGRSAGEVQEIKDEWEDEEVEGNGGLKVEGEPHTSCMDEMTCATAQHLWAMRCNVWTMTTRTWLTNKRTAHSRVSVLVRCVEGVLGLGGHVVIGVVLGFTTQTQYPWWSRCHWFRVRFHHADVIPRTDFFPSAFCSSLLYL